MKKQQQQQPSHSQADRDNPPHLELEHFCAMGAEPRARVADQMTSIAAGCGRAAAFIQVAKYGPAVVAINEAMGWLYLLADDRGGWEHESKPVVLRDDAFDRILHGGVDSVTGELALAAGNLSAAAAALAAGISDPVPGRVNRAIGLMTDLVVNWNSADPEDTR